MKYQTILVTGGAGFVGSHIALRLREDYPHVNVVAFDNLKRRGSELNLARLKTSGVRFIHGDIRNKGDFDEVGKADILIECSAEPSVLAGVDGSPEYLLDTNLVGTIHCLEYARRNRSDILFLSTSRVYSIHDLNGLSYRETGSRFELCEDQTLRGASTKGVSEDFPLGKYRSLYGTTKLCSELLLQEYRETYGLHGVINRCGVITGPWQMGKVDQGVIVLWLARHFWRSAPLTYIGYGGTGKQVRDFLHVEDLFRAIRMQIENIERYDGEVYNIGGGRENSLSLLEMTELCQKVTGNTIHIDSIAEDRPNDVRVYLSDSRKFQQASGWQCERNAETTFQEIYAWMRSNEITLRTTLA